MMEDASKPSWMCTQDLTSALTALSVHLLPGTHACGPEERIDCLLYKDGLPCCALIVTMTLVVTLRWVTLRVFSPLLRLLFVGRRRDSPYAPAEDLNIDIKTIRAQQTTAQNLGRKTLLNRPDSYFHSPMCIDTAPETLLLKPRLFSRDVTARQCS